MAGVRWVQSLKAFFASGCFLTGRLLRAPSLSTRIATKHQCVLFPLILGEPPGTAYSDQSSLALAFFQVGVLYFHSKCLTLKI